MAGDKIACIFSVAMDDPLIWEERNLDPAIYLHRIVTSPLFRGRGYTGRIINWAKGFYQEKGRLFIRLDTCRENKRLNEYYLQCGFSYSGVMHFEKSDPVPKHYLEGDLS